MTLAHSAASSSTALPAPVEDDLARVETRLAAELASREERVRREYRSTSWRDCAQQTLDLLDLHLGLTSSPPVREAA